MSFLLAVFAIATVLGLLAAGYVVGRLHAVNAFHSTVTDAIATLKVMHEGSNSLAPILRQIDESLKKLHAERAERMRLDGEGGKN